MVSSVIMSFMLLMSYGCNAAGEREADPSVSSSSRYRCSYCGSRIDKQTTILNRMSNASDELTKTGVVVDLPSQLERQAVSLDALKTSVVSDIPSQLEVQLSELKGIKDSVSDVTTTLSMNSKEL